MRLSNEHWSRLPVAFQASIRSLIGSPSMVDVDFTGFDVVDTAIFKHCRSLRRLKFSEIFELVVEKDSDADNAWPATFESLTILDTMLVEKMAKWATSTSSFSALRDLRIGFHPVRDGPHVGSLLRHVSGTLESLHLQPIYIRKNIIFLPSNNE
jgi:hypothetical protein